MSRCSSGRIVIEIDPKLKNRLHSMLALEGRYLKDWFIEQSNSYILSKKKFINGSYSKASLEKLSQERLQQKKMVIKKELI